MKVLALSRHGRLGASSRVRFYQYLPFLAAQGVEVRVLPLLPDRYLQDLYSGRIHLGLVLCALGGYLRRMSSAVSTEKHDLVWVQSEILPWVPAWAESIFARGLAPCVVDYDDALFHRYDMHRSPLVRILLSRKIDQVMRRSDLVLAGNLYIVRRAQEAGARRVEFLPSVIDTKKFQPTGHSRNGPFVIGWIGSPTTTRYLMMIESVLSHLCADDRTRVVAVGARGDVLRGTPVTIRPWSEDSEVLELQHFDVGIMPIPDGYWERGKCGYKLIQYMACGKPVVASPVGINSEIVDHKINGFLVNSREEWVEALTTLRANRNLGKEMGLEGRQKVEKEYSLQTTWPRLLSILESVNK